VLTTCQDVKQKHMFNALVQWAMDSL